MRKEPSVRHMEMPSVECVPGMDVTCDQCGAEYEFDETLLGDKGATVKCSNCNHVFRVLGKKDPGRAGLKLRFASTGRIEALSSLRELQLRVRNGEVTADDQLGRDGAGFRRLGDVPELSNFFAPTRAAERGPSPQQAPLQVSETSMPPTSTKDAAPRTPAQDAEAAKRTMVGVGPLNPHIPRPPRVPHVPGALPAAPHQPPSAPARSPLAASPLAAPTSNQPTTPGAARPPSKPEPAPQPAPSSQAPTVQGTALQYGGDGPAIARPLGNTPRSLAGVTAGPSPAAPGQGPVKLYLADDEAPPARATQGSSKVWLYAGMAVLLGGAGFVGLGVLNKQQAASEPAPPAAAQAPEAVPDAPAPAEGQKPLEQPTVSPPSAQAPTGQPSAAATPAAPPPEAVKAAASTSSKSSTTSSAKASAASSKTEKASSSSSSSTSSSSGAKDPSDYSGWVARGDQLFSRGDLSGAQAAYKSALDLRATGSEAHSGLGFALLADGRSKDAIGHFDRAASSGFAEANIGLGDAYRKLGQKSNAIEAYQNYLDRLPSGSKASYARTHIEALKGGSSGTSTPRESETPSTGPSDYKPAGEIGTSDENGL